MNCWPVQDAKLRFNELLNTCLYEGPQIIMRLGVETAVLVPIAECKRLNKTVYPSLKELLLAESDRNALALPTRSKANRRVISPL